MSGAITPSAASVGRERAQVVDQIPALPIVELPFPRRHGGAGDAVGDVSVEILVRAAVVEGSRREIGSDASLPVGAVTRRAMGAKNSRAGFTICRCAVRISNRAGLREDSGGTQQRRERGAHFGAHHSCGLSISKRKPTAPRAEHQYPDEAWLLIKYLASDTDAVVGLSNRLKNLPTTKAANTSPKLSADPAFKPFFKIYTNQKSVLNPLTPIGHPAASTASSGSLQWRRRADAGRQASMSPEALAAADRAYLLVAGRIRFAGEASALAGSELLHTAYLGGT